MANLPPTITGFDANGISNVAFGQPAKPDPAVGIDSVHQGLGLDAVVPPTPPSLSADSAPAGFHPNTPVGFGIDLFQNVTASTNDDGQTFTGFEIKVYGAGVAESLWVGGTPIYLQAGSGPLGTGSYIITDTDGVFTLKVSDLALTAAEFTNLIDDITYVRAPLWIPGSTGQAQAVAVLLSTVTDSGPEGSNVLELDQVATLTRVDTYVTPTFAIVGTPQTQAYTFTPGTPTTVVFDIEVLTDVAMVGSDISFSIALPQGWVASGPVAPILGGILSTGATYTVSVDVTPPAGLTAGTFPLMLQAQQNGLPTTVYPLLGTALAKLEPALTQPPSVTGTGIGNAEFTEDGAAAELFIGVTASTEDSGQTFTGATLTVAQLADGDAEVLHVGGTAITLVDAASGSLAGGGSYTVSLAGTTATVILDGLALGDAAMAALLESITYRNISQAPTAGERQITLTEVEDSGGQTAAPGLSASVTVEAVNDVPTFASVTGGTAWIPVTNQSDVAMAVAVQSDGKVLVTGYSNNQFSIVRMNAEGTLDTTFGDNGKAVLGSVSSLAQAYALEITADGKILLAGSDYGSGDMMVVRLTSDGELDPSFGDGGKALAGTTAYSEYGYAMLVQPDGKIVVTGYTGYGYNSPITAVRFEADGTVDATFGTAGVASITQVSGLFGGTGVAMDSDGNLLVAGGRELYPSNDFVVVRFKPDGTQDTAWGTWSTASVDLAGGSDEAKSVLVLPDGKILLAGTASAADYSTTHAAVVRLHADGTLDTSFGEQGKVLVEIGLNGDIHNMIRQPDGKLVLVGHSNAGGPDLVLIRLDENGELDLGFGQNGIATLDNGNIEIGRDVVLLPDGKLVVVGYGSNTSFYNDYLVVRLNADGSLDTSFNPQPGPSSLDGVADYTLGADAVILDASVNVYDAELAAQGHYDGAMLMLTRSTGASDDDVFGAGGALVFDNGVATLGGVDIGTVMQIGGTLMLNFNTNATQERVDAALSSITYSYVGTQPPASVTIAWSFSDGNIDGGPQGAGGGAFTTGSTQVNFITPNAAPTDISLSNSAVAENTDTSADLLIGSLSATDANAGDTHTYSIQPGGDGETFVIVGNELRLVAGTRLDHEAKSSYQVTIRATDGDGAFYDKLMTIEVTNVNEAPTFVVPQGGVQSIEIPGLSSIALASAEQADGKLIVVGRAGAFSGEVVVARLNTDGSLDASFADAGIARVPVAPFGSEGSSVAIQANGDILVSGSASLSNQGFFTIRFDPDGNQDPGFGSGGTLWTQVGSGTYYNTATLLQSDGSFIVTGYGTVQQGIGVSVNQLVAARYNADGTPDTSFGTAGQFKLEQNVTMRDATLDANGNMLMTGYVNEGGAWKYVVFRVDADGHLDTGFGDDGRVVLGMSGSADGYSVLAQADGKIVVTGTHWESGGYAFDVVRLTPDGERDAAFGVDGIVTLDLAPGSDIAYSVVQQGDKLLVAGSAGQTLVVVRLLEDGTLDATFGEGGKVMVATDNPMSEARSILLQADGKIAVVGHQGQAGGMASDILIVRLNADGSLDQAFHTQEVNTLDGVAQYALGRDPAVLDSDVRIFDPELAAQGHYDGASVTLARHGGADASDLFGASGPMSFADGNVVIDDNSIGTYTQAAGSLTIVFNAAATQALVNQALSLITYANTGSAPPPSVAIAWLFNDGNADNAQGTGTALAAVGTTTVDITIPNEAPTDISLSNASVAENADTAEGLVIGTLSTTDEDTGDTHTYSLVDGHDSAAFVIVGDQLQFAAGTVLDYEAKSSYQVTVRTTDARGASYDKLLTIELADVNEAPVAGAAIDHQAADVGAPYSFTVPAGAFVDPDAGDTLTYSATLGDGSDLPAWLSFDAATRTFSGTPDAGDVELDGLWVLVIATDGQGLSAQSGFALTVATVPTVLSLVRDEGAAEHTNADTIEFRITFSEPVTGVDAADFVLTSSGTAIGTVTGITRMHYDHAQYVVTVTTVSGDGVLALGLKNADTGITAEASGRPMASGYSGGESYTIDNTAPDTPSGVGLPTGGFTNVDEVAVDLDGLEDGASWEYSVDGGQNWLPGTGSSFALDDGDYAAGDIQVRQVDAAGNAGAPVATTAAVTVDTVAPQAPDVTSAALTNQPLPVISGTAQAGSTITLVVGGATYIAVATDGTWQVDLNTVPPSEGTLALNNNGGNAISVTATDPAGNVSQAGTQTLVIDTTAPDAPAGVALPGGGFTNVNTVTVDPDALEAGASWEYSVDGGQNWTPGGGDGFLLQDGPYAVGDIQVRQIDAAGNPGTPLVNTEGVFIDTVAPAAPALVNPELTNSALPVIDGTAESGSTITLVIGGATYTTVAAGGGWSIDLATAVPSQGTLALNTNGSNAISVTARDPAGNVSQAGTQALVIDTTAPDAPTGVVLPAGGPTNVDTVGIDLDALEDGASWEYSLDGGQNWLPGSGDSFVLQDGDYAAGDIRVRQVDAAGNPGVPIATTAAVTVDTVEPDAPSVDSTALTNQTTPVISGTAEAGSTITLLVGGATYTTVATDGGWSVDLATAVPSQGTLALNVNGGNTVSVTSTDPAGNVSDANTQMLVIDTAAPDAPAGVVLPVGGPTNVNEITVELDALEDGASWEYSVDGGQNWLPGVGGSFVLEDGDYAAGDIQVRQVDAAGNPGAPVATTAAATIDTVEPDAPSVDSTALTNQALPVISGTAESGSTITVVIGGATYTTLAADGSWSIDLATAVPGQGTLALNTNGGNAVSVTSTDPAGNVSSVGTQTLVIDTTAPIAPSNVTLPLGGATHVNEVTVELDALEDGASWEYSVDGGQNWLPGVGGSFVLEDGEYAAGDIQVRQIDAAGNPGMPAQTAASVVIDTAAPVAPSITSLALSNAAAPTITGTAETGSTVAVVVGGATYVVVAADGTWRVDLATATPEDNGTLLLNANGGNTVSVTATDPAGNVSQAGTQTLVIDTTPPGAPGLAFGAAGDHWVVTVSGLEAGSSWQYKVDAGAWVNGQGNSFNIPLQAYESGLVQVRQIDAAGNVGTIGRNADALTPPATDLDGDGLDDDIENGVPGMAGGAQGDGNGDGIPDVEQSDVTSLVWSQSPDAQVRYVTLVNDAGLTQQGVSTATLETGSLPQDLALPLGALAFTVRNVPDSGIVNFSVYVDGDLPINGYFKQVDGQWYDIATAITEVGGKVRIDFSIEDGGMFDADGERNGVIVDPGAPGFFDGDPRDMDRDQVPDLLEAGLGLSVGVKDNDVFARDDLFVMQLYRDALGREAEADGVSYWQGQLAHGMGREALVQTVLGSAEAGTLDTLARLALGLDERAPADAELADWRAGAAQGQSQAELADAYVLAHYGDVDAAALVDALYADLLGRDADAQGRAYWIGQLDQGASAGEVAWQLVHSTEFDQARGAAADIASLYAGLLGRAADAAGLAYWSDAVADGMSMDAVIVQITASTEYHDRFLPTEDIG
ncbi:DUF4214 domain-containing protein [Verticiella sediminum]|uniref:DUF4214 domain-containing protein n=1 Tax=Verticiella sediminum TaxID=1247510 RepID=A0A556AQ51_9BURK|nr:Ig-like domain-containing protein [Verticiella sediminum]TSH95010.1 DUF4214 domain-containing protein [Verticiella sediminum]